MKNIELKDVIKEVVLNYQFANPLSDEFSENKFLLKYATLLNEDYKEFEIINQEKGKEIIDIILELNYIYDNVMRQIEELIDETNLNSIDLIEQIFAMLNYDYFTLKDKLITNITEDKSKTPKAIDEDLNKKVKNIFGDELDIQDAADISVDICNFLMEIIISFKPQSKKNTPVLKDEKQFELIRKLIFIANIFVNIENAFKFYKYEFGDLQRSGKTIIFKHFPETYYIQQIIGKQRYSSLIQENSFYAYNYFKEKSLIPVLRIKNSTVQIINNIQAEDPYNIINKSVFIAFYFHLHGVKLKYFENATVLEIIDILSAVQSCFNFFNADEIIKSTYENQDIKFVPFRIKKDELVKFIIKKTKLKKSIIIKTLNIINSTFNQIPDLWSTPLIQVVDYYYFIMPSLADAHLAYLLDKILQRALSSEKQANIFKQFILKEFNKPLDNGYQFEFVKEEKLIEISEELKDNIVILTKNNLIILELCNCSFSIQSAENYSNIVSLSNTSTKLNKKKEFIRKNIHKLGIVEDKNIFGIVLTNHTLFSGLYLNYNHIIDFFLLKNYFIAGELRQGKVIYGNSEIHTQELASFKYYTNEDEFNNKLKEFLFKPTPIFDKIKNYIQKEYLIVPKEMEPQIYRDGIVTLPLTSRIWEQINEVEYYLNQLYYFEKDYNDNEFEKRFLEDKISYYLPQIFSLLAFEEDRTIRIYVINKFKAAHLQSFSYFILTYQKNLSKLGEIRIKKNGSKSTLLYKPEEIQKILEKLLEENLIQGTSFNLSNFVLLHQLDIETLNKVIRHLIELLSTLSQKNYSEEELNNYLLFLAVFLSLSKNKTEFKKELYFTILNFVDSLNFNNFHQQARDFSEGILEFSLKEEDIPIIGWLCLFRCYIKQHNHFDAIFYGNLFVSALITLPEAEEFVLLEALYNSLLFYRNFGFHHFVDDIYNFLKDFPADEYEKQKFTLSYFNSRLQHDYSKIETLYKDAEIYLKENIEKIINYEEKGALPWVAFILNLKNFHKLGLIKDVSSIEEYFIKLKSEVSTNSFEDLELKFYPNPQKSKELLIKTLIKVFGTRNFEDLASELNELQLLANNVISISIEPVDIKSLFLAGLIINDNSLTFLTKETQEFAPLFNDNESIVSYIENYANNILKNLYINDYQIIIWLFEFDKKVYCFIINSQKVCELKPINNWNLDKMKNWLSKLSDFYYYNKKGGFFINEQEEEYVKILENTDFAVLNDIPSDKEILFYSSLHLSEFPHNLLQTNFRENSNAFNNHEEFVKEYLKSNSDFISFNTSITNIISIDWFADNGKEIHLSKHDFTIEAWIPTIDDDTNLYIGYDKLRPIIEGAYNGIIHTGLLPDKVICSTINVFLAHGGKGFDGFRTLYTRNFDGRAITKEYGVEKVFGTGVIAVLFVCNSASISKEIYSQKLNSFTNTILSLGYRAVIAPAWSLFTDISSVWLEAFLNELKSGLPVGQAVHKANISVAKNEYVCYYTPTAWAAMHLYGNPNIYFINEE